MGHTHRYSLALKKKKYQVRSPSPESRVPETGSDPPIGSDQDSGRDSSSSQLWDRRDTGSSSTSQYGSEESVPVLGCCVGAFRYADRP